MLYTNFLAITGAVLVSSASAQVYTDEIPSVVGRTSTLAASTAAIVSPAGGDPLSAIINSIVASVASNPPASSAVAASSTSAASRSAISTSTMVISGSTSTASTSSTSTYSIPFGSTLSNGAYVCNPAHSYAPNLSCDGSGSTPTLVTISVTATGAASSTTSTGAAGASSLSYADATGTATGWIATWTGAAAGNAIPVAGALVAGVVGLFA